jgi:hypothetical protein
MIALLLALLTLSILSSGASSVHIRSVRPFRISEISFRPLTRWALAPPYQAQHVRQSSSASAHDTFCTKARTLSRSGCKRKKRND